MIQFTIAKRGLVPAEEEEFRGTVSADGTNVARGKQAAEVAGGEAEKKWLKSLRPQLCHGGTVDAVKFQSGSFRLPSVVPEGELLAALGVLQRVMLHELEKGNAVTLPFIGTFRLSLKGEIEIKDASDGKGRYYHGRDVRVDNLLFRPDSELLSKVRRFKVEQAPYGMAFHAEEDEIKARFTELFARQESVSHQDVYNAFEMTLTHNRISYLLRRLVRDGRLIALGRGAQMRYRAAAGFK